MYDVSFCRQDDDDWNLAVWVYNGRSLALYINHELVQEKFVLGECLSPRQHGDCADILSSESYSIIIMYPSLAI